MVSGRIWSLAIGSGLLILASTHAFSTHAFAAGPFSESLASNLVQARAQQRILKEDDAADMSCRNRAFTTTAVVRQPEVVPQGRVSETKWQEQWTLMRCGQAVGYRVFFTEVGAGGGYFSVVRTD